MEAEVVSRESSELAVCGAASEGFCGIATLCTDMLSVAYRPSYARRHAEPATNPQRMVDCGRPVAVHRCPASLGCHNRSKYFGIVPRVLQLGFLQHTYINNAKLLFSYSCQF